MRSIKNCIGKGQARNACGSAHPCVLVNLVGRGTRERVTRAGHDTANDGHPPPESVDPVVAELECDVLELARLQECSRHRKKETLGHRQVRLMAEHDEVLKKSSLKLGGNR